jgi:hypothetical protein
MFSFGPCKRFGQLLRQLGGVPYQSVDHRLRILAGDSGSIASSVAIAVAE